MKKTLIFGWLVLIFCQNISGQSKTESPYFLKTNREIVLISSGLLTIGAAEISKRALPKPFSETEILALNSSNVRFKMDRNATKNWSNSADKWSNLLLYSSGAAAAATIVFAKNDHKNRAVLALMGAESVFLTFGLTQISKNWAHRTRPFVYNPNAPLSEKMKIDARRSFFSGHTSFAAMGCFFTAKVISDFHPDEKWTAWVWSGAAVLPALTGFARVRAGKHFPTDVLAGYAAGALIGWGVPELHRQVFKSKFEKKGGHAAAFFGGGATLFALSFKF